MKNIILLLFLSPIVSFAQDSKYFCADQSKVMYLANRAAGSIGTLSLVEPISYEGEGKIAVIPCPFPMITGSGALPKKSDFEKLKITVAESAIFSRINVKPKKGYSSKDVIGCNERANSALVRNFTFYADTTYSVQSDKDGQCLNKGLSSL